MYTKRVEKCKFYRCAEPAPRGEFCSDFCRDMHIDRNPVERDEEEVEEMEEWSC